jgi:NAD+ diphosphatase
MHAIPLGAAGNFTLVIAPEHLADQFKDAMLPPVLATPMMIMMMENAALNAIRAYLEPGESAEDAVAREVAEESGIEVGAVQYHSSQPWPFPASLMLGYMAHAETHQIQRGDGELEHARWFTPREMARDMAAGRLLLPPPVSIAYHLIEAWFDTRSQTPLSELAVDK